jgi:hypothetical protein
MLHRIHARRNRRESPERTKGFSDVDALTLAFRCYYRDADHKNVIHEPRDNRKDDAIERTS